MKATIPNFQPGHRPDGVTGFDSAITPLMISMTGQELADMTVGAGPLAGDPNAIHTVAFFPKGMPEAERSAFMERCAQAPLPSANDIDAGRVTSPEAFRTPGNHRFRKKYRKLMPPEEILADAIKDKAGELADLIDDILKLDQVVAGRPNVGREVSLAHTHLEDAIMRAIRGVTA